MVNDTVAVTAATSMASITWRQGLWMYLRTVLQCYLHSGQHFICFHIALAHVTFCGTCCGNVASLIRESRNRAVTEQ